MATDACELRRIIDVVGPAGLHQTPDINGLGKTEIAGNPDISLCLSQRRVSSRRELREQKALAIVRAIRPKPVASKHATAPSKSLSAYRLRQVLDYDPESGIFRWLVKSNSRVNAGDIAGHLKRTGYVHIGVDGTDYAAHRLAFLYMVGVLARVDVDHADGNKSNNRWSNLRLAGKSLNGANAKRRRDNTSGFKGVTWNGYRWEASIQVSGRQIRLGTYTSPEEAHAAYCGGAKVAFGKFARAA
jgi:hypothetical protein